MGLVRILAIVRQRIVACVLECVLMACYGLSERWDRNVTGEVEGDTRKGTARPSNGTERDTSFFSRDSEPGIAVTNTKAITEKGPRTTTGCQKREPAKNILLDKNTRWN
jgi:hypothetical protein